MTREECSTRIGVTNISLFSTTKGLYVICQTTIAVLKEYNIKRHYSTKHSTLFDAVEGQDRVNKLGRDDQVT